ncbi:MAG: hypothetical protein LBK60_05445 [Verrucomicrobiales bacterium]|nr:hypothetical protein [Verrucomicrobiales bacterium]
MVGVIVNGLLILAIVSGARAQQVTVSAAPSQSELREIREQIKALEAQLQNLQQKSQEHTSKLLRDSVLLEEFNNWQENGVTRSDLDALKDLQDEQIKRGVGSRYLISLSGYLIETYTNGFGGKQGSTPTSSLSVPNGGITLAGTLREDPYEDGDVNYRLGVLANGANFSLGDAYLRWDLKTNKGVLEPPWTLYAQVGQALVPFGGDNLAAEDKIPTINKAQYVSNLGFGRDIGVILNGGIKNTVDPASGLVTPLLGYWAGFVNGNDSQTGNGANKINDSSYPDAVLKLVYAPFPEYFSFWRGLKFGGSLYYGNVGAAGGKHPHKNRYGLDFEWLRKPFLVTGEYVRSEDGYPGAIAISNDFVFTLFWTPSTLPDFQPWFRFDRYEPNGVIPANGAYTLANRNTSNIYSVGINWFIWQTEPVTRRTYETLKTERVIKLQLAYDFVDQQDAPVDNRLTARATVTF